MLPMSVENPKTPSLRGRPWPLLLAGVVAALGSGAASAADPPPLPRERDLIGVLRSETPEADKAAACKQLAIHGSSDCVGDVAAYLDNERLASWARITLEAIPGDEASAALRAAVGRLSGRLLVGVINSLGVRRDAAAVPLLAARLADTDAHVSAAAAAALGKIGTPMAAAALGRALAGGGRDAVAEACVVCGERLHEAGDVAGAVALWESVRGGDVSEQRRAEASRAVVLARGRDGLALLAELLRSPTRRLFNMGLCTARELAVAGDRDPALAAEVDRVLLAAIASAAGVPGADGRSALVITLLGDCNAVDGREGSQGTGSGAAAPVQTTLLEAAAGGPPVVRTAAIAAVGRCGDASAAARLIEIAAGGDAAVATAVRQAVASMPAAGVDARIVAELATADPARLPLVIGLIGDRRIVAAADRVLALADHSDAGVQAAALGALGSIVDLETMDVLVRRAVSPRDEGLAPIAAAALKEAAVRMADREACAARIVTALPTAGSRSAMLLETLADVGGTTALEAVAAAARSGDPDLQDVATKVLGKWMTADAAPVLLALARNEAVGGYRGRALKGYLRIARQFTLSEAERAAMCREALATAQDAADKKAAIEILVRYPHAATLAVAREAVENPAVATEARAAVATIEGKLPKAAPGGR